MKILIDTNIIISTALSPYGTAYDAFSKAVTDPNSTIVCSISIDEAHDVIDRKFPKRKDLLDSLVEKIISLVEIVPVPDVEVPDEMKIRDEKDRPIFRAAVTEGVDILLSGDKDFLEAGISTPKIVTPADFLKMFQSDNDDHLSKV